MTDTVVFDGLPLLFSEPSPEELPEEMTAERSARLLEAGKYPDKNLTLTESDLEEIAARFAANSATETLPVKVEHVDSPLDPLGRVVRVWREGTALLGTLAFPDDLAAFLRRRGAAKLSVGLSREPLALREVSLVLKPRVATATLLSAGPTPGAALATRRASTDPSLLGKGKEFGSTLHSEIVRLRAELAARDVDAQVAAFRAQGRILPAAEGAARALLAAGETATAVTLSHGTEPVAAVFRWFLEAMPPAIVFGESVVSASGTDPDGFTHYEHTFLSKHLGVDPAKVAALIRQEKQENDGGKHHAH